jgi:hypothetical protein
MSQDSKLREYDVKIVLEVQFVTFWTAGEYGRDRLGISCLLM